MLEIVLLILLIFLCISVSIVLLALAFSIVMDVLTSSNGRQTRRVVEG